MKRLLLWIFGFCPVFLNFSTQPSCSPLSFSGNKLPKFFASSEFSALFDLPKILLKKIVEAKKSFHSLFCFLTVSVKEVRFRSLEGDISVYFSSCGIDESFLNICGKDHFFRLFATFLKKLDSVKGCPLYF